ncbi:isocitrate lyase/phosphoenolpyruvate mutase family protein [Nonomuraea sp. NPDC050663]|uniref:isocitrate lyase/phosphoenolpyruvate mutase family protein n=1 Tax=Nonomuraea sp. NPDC050663 TaxID=3364370 RepID=UPI0037B4B0FD
MTFADLHRPGDPFLLPNAWDYGSAALLAEHGFPAVATTSLGVAAVHGKRDAAGATMNETIALAAALRPLDVMVSVDVEAGFSDDPDEVAELVLILKELGVHGVNIEDGRPDGTLREIAHQRDILQAACGHGVFVNARTDTHWLGTGDVFERVQAYSFADGVFVPGLTDLAMIAEVAAVRPLNVLYQAAGPSMKELAAAGVARISTGSLLYRAALRGAVETALAIQGRDAAPELPTIARIMGLLPR